MRYNLACAEGIDKARARLEALIARGAWVEIEDKTYKTPQQNRYLHALIGYFGAVQGYKADYVKEHFFKRAANHDLFVVELTNCDGQPYEALRSVRELTKEETTAAIERFRNWASSEACLYLPTANDLAAVNEMEKIIEEHSAFL